jgi:DNA-binding response OmpR family regulator
MSRILVLEDETRIADYVARALTAEGYAVDTAHDGLEGLTLAQTGRYDLVLLDLRLPRLDGVSVLRGIMQWKPAQAVFVLSAITDVRAKVRCLQLGATDFLSKPFDLGELSLRIRARIGQPSPGPLEQALHTGPVTLDLRRMTADRGHGPVRLSPREFRLLQYLISRSGEVCTRQQLLAEVWDCSFDPGTNIVDVYVGRIRSKLGNDLVETIRNVGYSLTA